MLLTVLTFSNFKGLSEPWGKRKVKNQLTIEEHFRINNSKNVLHLINLLNQGHLTWPNPHNLTLNCINHDLVSVLPFVPHQGQVYLLSFHYSFPAFCPTTIPSTMSCVMQFSITSIMHIQTAAWQYLNVYACELTCTVNVQCVFFRRCSAFLMNYA